MLSDRSIITPVALLVMCALLFSGCGKAQPVTVVFTVDGMTCESCSRAITDVLSTIDGVETASADHLGGRAHAVFREGSIDEERLVDEIEGLGYTVTDVRRVSNTD
jgi:copper chaperone CopZ